MVDQNEIPLAVDDFEDRIVPLLSPLLGGLDQAAH